MDYGSGNVMSVYNIITYLGYNAIISNTTHDIQSATHIILPGVGSFSATLEKIKSKIPLTALENEVIHKSKPFLGICVGMQLLADKGNENGEHNGLGWITGIVEKLEINNNFSLPHIGWNNVIPKKESQLFQGLKDINDFYFVHSYVLKTNDKHVLAETCYESNFCSAVQKENIYGVQFHPEKSQKVGQQLLKNFFNI